MIVKNKENKKSDVKLESIIQKLAEGIENGSLTIIKQDSIVIQINTCEKIILRKEYLDKAV